MKLISLSVILGLTTCAWNINGFTDAVWPVLIGNTITMTGLIITDAYGDVEVGVNKHSTEVIKRWWIIVVSGYGLIVDMYGLFFIYNCIYYWIAFDIAYNIYAGNKWNYLGTTAWLDRIFSKWWQQYIIKIIVLCGILLDVL